MDWRLNTQHLEQYESVFRTRGFRKASRELSVSHNTIRKNIERLEAQIGKPLFASKGSPLQFTTLGEQIGQCLMSELKLLSRINAEIRALSELPTGVIVGIPAIESTQALHAHLIRLANRSPCLEIELASHCDLNDVMSGLVHLGIFLDRPTAQPTIAPDDCIGGIRIDVPHAFYSARNSYPERLIGGYTDEEWEVLESLSLPSSIEVPSKQYGIRSAYERSQLASAGYGIACLPVYGKEHDPTLVERTDYREFPFIVYILVCRRYSPNQQHIDWFDRFSSIYSPGSPSIYSQGSRSNSFCSTGSLSSSPSIT